MSETMAGEELRRVHDELERRIAARTEELARTITVLQGEIDERQKAEERLLRLNRLYAVLSETNKAIVRAPDRDTLFHQICRIAVEQGGFRMAWVGLADEESGIVEPVASYGTGESYLAGIRISTTEEPAGLGPTGSAIRAGSYYICNDFPDDPRTLPWRAKAQLHGFLSSAAIALYRHGRTIGALTLYAEVKSFFDAQLAELLQQMAADISFALDNLEWKTRLRESEGKYRALFEESKDVIFIMSVAGRLLDVNPAGVELLGYSKEELAALDIASCIYCDSRERERFRRALLDQGFVRDYDVLLNNKSGEELHVLLTASVIRDGRGEVTGYRGIIHDVTERKRLEQQLRQAQKMESIGLLAGGVAHDFNNLLTAISGYGQIIQEQFSAGDEMLALCIGQIMTATGRAVELTRNLLAFGRKQIINPKPVCLNGIVINVSKLLSKVIGEDIEFGTVLASGNLTVLADCGQIDQVLINLAANARDAMPRGGRLRIATELARLDQEEAGRRDLAGGGGYALLKVSDDGEGMERETLERIFEPFFTTKATGKGTGLGLSIIYGIVKQHNGAVFVTSEPGRGTTFAIYLPLIEAAVDDPEERQAPPLPGGTETLLVAEDDALVRSYLRKMLEMAGYTVIAAQDGADAVEQFQAHREKIALVLCDVVMPKKNGREVYEEIRAMAPQALFLFTSGYNDEIIHSKGVLLDGIDFLEKPVSREKLLTKLREILDRGEG